MVPLIASILAVGALGAAAQLRCRSRRRSPAHVLRFPQARPEQPRVEYGGAAARGGGAQRTPTASVRSTQAPSPNTAPKAEPQLESIRGALPLL